MIGTTLLALISALVSYFLLDGSIQPQKLANWFMKHEQQEQYATIKLVDFTFILKIKLEKSNPIDNAHVAESP